MKKYTISLSPQDAFQLLDALESRAESYEFTARYMTGEVNPNDEFRTIEECSSPEEAVAIARHFRDVADAVRKQVAEQEK